jgi:DNA-binding NarL/FixJ family response regulator
MGHDTAVLVEDHQLVREALRRLLEDADIDVVGEAADGLTGVELALVHRPSVVLMDVQMSVMDGVAATRALRRRWSDAPVLLLSMFGDPHLQGDAYAAGASGYLVKDCTKAELLAAFQRVANGGRMDGADLHPAAPAAPRLSRRQTQILQLLADGASPGEAGDALGISEATVNNHLGAAYRTLEVSNRVAAIVRAAQLGQIDLPPGDRAM